MGFPAKCPKTDNSKVQAMRAAELVHFHGKSNPWKLNILKNMNLEKENNCFVIDIENDEQITYIYILLVRLTSSSSSSFLRADAGNVDLDDVVVFEMDL